VNWGEESTVDRHHFNDSVAAADYLRAHLRAGDLVYIKGSRGIGLEKVLDRFRTDEETN
jgi:UDP-N-acetylmuramyl pentapeptide synthase